MSNHKPVKLPSVATYEVGYGKPPQSKRFRKGQSGNPSGRPKGSKNKQPQQWVKMKDMLLDEAYRNVTIQDREGPLNLPIARAAMRSLALKAAQGNVSAQKLFLKILNDVESERVREHREFIESAVQYTQWAYMEIAYRKEHNIAYENEILPHPDHVIINDYTGEVRIDGPADRKSKVVWDELWAKKVDCEEELEELRLEREKGGKVAPLLDMDIVGEQYVLEIVEQAIIMRWNRPASEVIKDPKRRPIIKERIKKNIWPLKPNFVALSQSLRKDNS